MMKSIHHALELLVDNMADSDRTSGVVFVGAAVASFSTVTVPCHEPF